MKFLSCEKISDHKYKTPEGYLICIDSILARTGKQTYKRREVFGVDCTDAESEVDVDRTPEEVFSDKTLASFENKPLTMEHPDEDVNIDNHNTLSVGFARDIKRGKTDKGEDVMLGTLVFTDADAIEAIESGDMTDLSCGYDCDIVDEANPCQRNIRGNHIALCQQGRAGIARIVDSNTTIVEASALSIGNKVNFRGRKYTVVSIKKNAMYNGEVDITLKEDNGSERVIEAGERDKFMLIDSVKEEQPSIKALGKWEWDEVMQDWYDNGRHMYYNEVIRKSGGKDSIKDSDLPEEEDSEFLFRDAYGKEIFITNWDGKNQFMVVYEGREQLMNRRDVEQFLDRKGAKFSRVLRDSIKDGFKYRILLRKNYDKQKWDYLDGNNSLDEIRYAAENWRQSGHDVVIIEEDTKKKISPIGDSTKDSLREPTQSELKKFEDYLIQRHWHVKKLGVTWTGRIHYEVSKLVGQGENEKLLMSEIHSAEYTSGLDMTYSIGSTGKELKGVVDIDKVYVRDSIKDNSTREKIEEFVSKHPGKIHHNSVVKMYENKYSCMVAPENAAFVKNELSKMGFKNIRQPDSEHVVFEDSDTYNEVTKNLKSQAKKEMKDDASFEWMRRIPDGDFEFIKGGYGMRFKDRQKYENAKRIAKQVGHTKGHWYDKDLEYFEYGSTQIGNEDSLKQFKVKYKDSKGRQVIHLVKASSLSDAMKKVKGDKQ